MTIIYSDILRAKAENKKLLAVLLDPEKLQLSTIIPLLQKIEASPATHIFLGGSTFGGAGLDEMATLITTHTRLPLLLFPGSVNQLTNKAHGLLFLMLLSGRNSEYLIEQQIQAVPMLEQTDIEVISTGYILIESGAETAVQRVSDTEPIDRNDCVLAKHTAKAGEYIGNKLIYLEAGSGAIHPVPLAMIQQVAQSISIPLIVGGGIRSNEQIEQAYNSGADMVVIGTAFEKDTNFFEKW